MDREGLPGGDEYAEAVGDWLDGVDLAGSTTEPSEPVALPPADAPVSVVRPVRLPYEVHEMVKALAQARGVTMSDLIREWVQAGLAAAGTVPDPVTELRRGLDSAQRALDQLAARGVRDAA
ncbi:hypothetical protein [Planosporangium mesophilum]|nr:hypothetical protein [Planosporangium mesophilum]NJC82934.1 hypothetical protein [Planosporangium mesophilum]